MRHKRQALQDMARPLKQWLYKHRDNPYPTKTEKILLALGSQMTLVQVIQSPPMWVSPLAARVLLRLRLIRSRIVPPEFRGRSRCQVQSWKRDFTPINRLSVNDWVH